MSRDTKVQEKEKYKSNSFPLSKQNLEVHVFEIDYRY